MCRLLTLSGIDASLPALHWPSADSLRRRYNVGVDGTTKLLPVLDRKKTGMHLIVLVHFCDVGDDVLADCQLAGESVTRRLASERCQTEGRVYLLGC